MILALWIVAAGALVLAAWALWRTYRQAAHDRMLYELLQFKSEGYKGFTSERYVGGLAERMKAEIVAARTLRGEGV